MTFYFLLVFVLFMETKSQVLNAEKAELGELKHLVYLQSQFNYYKGHGIVKSEKYKGAGTIINMNWVLTAAHVVADFNETVDEDETDNFSENKNLATTSYFRKKVRIIAGVKNYKDAMGQKRVVKRNDVYVHRKYVSTTKKYDVALLHLKKNPLFESDTVEPAKLLEPGITLEDGVDCVVSGWGAHGYSIDPNDETKFKEDLDEYARQGSMSLLNWDNCKIYADYDFDLHLCYGCNEGSCSITGPGDSGAPVVCALNKNQDPGYVSAIHSFGCEDPRIKCTNPGPSVGTDVREITDWMKKKIKEVESRTARIIAYVITAATIIVSVVRYYM